MPPVKKASKSPAEPVTAYSLGELEAQLLDVIWDIEPPVSTTQVFKVMYPRRELSYSTIMLTMAKLSKKGILTQTRIGNKKTDAFLYVPNITREQMGKLLLDEVARKVLGKPLHKAIRDLLPGCSEEELKKIEKALAK